MSSSRDFGGSASPLGGGSPTRKIIGTALVLVLLLVTSLAFVDIGLRRWPRPESARVRILLVAAASYASLFVLLLWAALRGQSVAAPDAMTLVSLAAWATGTAVAIRWVAVRSRAVSRDGYEWMVV